MASGQPVETSRLVHPHLGKMDTEKLINCVFERTPLWDQKNKMYHNRDMSRLLWNEVANELGLPREVVKVKWRGLRDIFRRELQKERCSELMGGRQAKSRWAYFQKMMFIKDHVTNRIPIGNIVAMEDAGNVAEDESAASDDNLDEEPKRSKIKLSLPRGSASSSWNAEQDDDQGLGGLSSPTSHTVEVPHLPCKLEIGAIDSALDGDNTTYDRLVEDKKVKPPCQRCSNSMEDSDHHFLMSLLPYLGKVAPERKMLVRNKIQQVFCDEEEFNQQRSRNSYCD
ncbi:uncharacterized protein [Anabrus simplex]|uniref:uncharacterized protein n=1 Tax=Anabrus simplex TaxID=316456 RepID=UPI0035A2F462